jgi:hypothetical protein
VRVIFVESPAARVRLHRFPIEKVQVSVFAEAAAGECGTAYSANCHTRIALRLWLICHSRGNG